MLRRLMNLPLTVASKAAKAFQDREDARTKEKYGTAYDPGDVPTGGEAAAPHVDEQGTPEMGALEVMGEVQAGRAVAFVDVRDAGRWAGGHIRGAIHMPAGEINVRVSELPWDALVIAYCDDGKLSRQAVAFFRERGQEDTFVLAGGLGGWREAGGEVVK